MMKKALLLFCGFLTLTAIAQQAPNGITASNGKLIGFYQYTPTDYGTSTSVKYPLIIFLHGIGERGNGTTDLWKVKREGIPAYIENGHRMQFNWNGKSETFLVLSPAVQRRYEMVF